MCHVIASPDLEALSLHIVLAMQVTLYFGSIVQLPSPAITSISSDIFLTFKVTPES